MKGFSHENLIVYRRALDFCAQLDDLSESWGTEHAISDHLPRAAESVVENLAEASAAHSGAKETYMVYCLGSALECAACLDIAVVKSLLPNTPSERLKAKLLEICRMLIGLRKAWLADQVREDPPTYGKRCLRTTKDSAARGFHHERLGAYQAALEVVRWVSMSVEMRNAPSKLCRRLDELSTSIVLNIAEGNGRFSNEDQRRFIEMANRAGVRMAAQLDLCLQRRQLTPAAVTEAKQRLLSAVRMTGSMLKDKSG